MSYKVKISNQAEADLRKIFEHIAYELHSVQNAHGQLDRLEENILSLNQMPNRYKAYGKEPWYSRGMRIMPVDNYIVFYIPDHDTHLVNIVRVMYGGRDIDTHMSEFTDIAICPSQRPLRHNPSGHSARSQRPLNQQPDLGSITTV